MVGPSEERVARAKIRAAIAYAELAPALMIRLASNPGVAATPLERSDRRRAVFDRITFDPRIMGGRACIRGMRIPCR
jgi:uncharacterized protein (DUF433 family)